VSPERTAAMNAASSAPSSLASVMVINPSTGSRVLTTDDVAEDFSSVKPLTPGRSPCRMGRGRSRVRK
jgi:hypothetical protein